MDSIKRIVSAVLLLIFATSGVAAGVIEVQLPEFQGAYTDPYDDWSVVSFTLPQFPVSVDSVSMRLTGEVTVGWIECELAEDPLPWDFVFVASVLDSASGVYWYATFQDAEQVSDSLDWTVTFEAHGAAWDFLANGQVELAFLGQPSSWGGICIGDPPRAVLDGVFFVVAGDFRVASEPTTWGRIKALYED